jgi:hypothetical protein
MTVKQLKEKLAAVDDNLRVYIYSNLDEGGADAYNVEVGCGLDDFPYCQGDPPESLSKNQKFVIIQG